MRLRPAVIVVLLGALTVVGVQAAASASAGSADECTDVAARASAAGTVFVGTTRAVADGVVTLQVTDVFKGSPGSAVRLSSADDAWRVDRQYLVFATGTGPQVAPDRCGTPVPVDDRVIAAVAGALGPGTPLGRGAGAEPPSSVAPSTAPTSAPTETSPSDPSDARATGGTGDDGSSTSRLLLGIILGLALLGSFLLPQLRRHHRERRRRRRDGVDDEPFDPDLSEEWRQR